jgi:2-dehydropantoate 2-reductase
VSIAPLSTRHWHVLGAGAIGCLFASALHRSGCTTTLLLRECAAGNTRPVVVQRHEVCSELHLPVATAADCGPISHLLVTTKAYDAHTAVTAVAAHLDQGSQVLLLVNGMGVADALRHDFPQLDIFLGTTTEGAYRMAPLHINHAGRGQTRIGQPGRAVPPAWFDQWSRSVDDCLWDTDIVQALWQKLAINCAINPLTALHGCANGELARNPQRAREVSGLCREIALISEAAGYTAIATQLGRTVAGVVTGTADNRSSMLQDVQAGRRTEIDYITGYLLQVAARHGIAAPRNSELLARIHDIDR